MQSLIVTGGAGFIGSAFVRSLVEESTDTQVLVLDKLTYAGNLASLKSVTEKIEFIRGDILDRRLVAKLLTQHRPTAIVHFAAESHVDRSIDAPAPFVETNVLGTSRLLEATLDYWLKLEAPQRQQFRFVQISTDEVFGSVEAPDSFNEQSRYHPSSPYAASKAAADHFVRAFQRTYGLPTILSYSTNNYGPFQFPEKLVPVVVLHALEGRSIPLYGDGQHQRDWLHVNDHCAALRLLLEKGYPGESYCIASGTNRTNRDVVEMICSEVDRQSPTAVRPTIDLLQPVADRPGHDRRYALDASRIRALGWRPKTSFQPGIAETVAWYLANRPWVEEVTRDFDRTTRMGLR